MKKCLADYTRERPVAHRSGGFISKLNVGLLAAGVMVTMLAGAPANAEGITFEGKRIEGIVPAGPGGAGDTYVRFFAEWYARFLPGEPTIIARNMGGGGSLISANWFEANAQLTGETLYLPPVSGMLTYVLQPDDPNLNFDPAGWRPFISSAMGRVLYVHADTGIKGVEDLSDYDGELTIGIAAPTGSDMPSMLSMTMLGLDVRPIVGMQGGDQALAFQRGELSVGSDTASGYLTSGAELAKEGIAVPLFSFGVEDEAGNIIRDPNFPELPTFVEAYEIVHGKAPDGPGYELWRTLHSLVVTQSKSLVLPAGTPDDVYEAYVEASKAIVAEPDFAEAAAVRIGAYPQRIGEAAQVGTVTLSEDARTFLEQWLQEEVGVAP